METIGKYFPGLSGRQLEQFGKMEELYREWNGRINVISRRDMDNLATHHILHSLAIAKLMDFPAGSRILDVGTGGGFPGIPLAVMFPCSSFTLCDSIGKKIKVAGSVAESLQLENVECINSRAEALEGGFDYVVSRAVTGLATFYPWIKGKFSKAVLCLKGGDLDEEIRTLVRRCHVDPGLVMQVKISNWFEDPFFEEKKIVIISQ